ncbi:hypothetical protein GGI04_003561 [Coemansia thaxteri]|uniref:Tudor domain-containing protein n=1 Tax=Coemansia thaxteri TaxID=2663907 RepID=A0A9W8BG09_9FUNG|nr:hypothetical protein H4R26_004567 [Coemansia thaxteri]KAJ2001897.1 hypothetical protein GGI04_003561 [Coemansia thaxteri]KAJ2470171.1 hypothetical protein GGI02_003102 [Coemansia sp. RSA 2322]KAJ2479099.1 hypothetical protein EV174_004115 [Coemansia sp. RSA 2320]
MDASEIEIYVTKLAEVELALSADPGNTELQTLKSEIEDLLLLSSQLLDPATPSTADAKDVKAVKPKEQQRMWQLGDECQAMYAGDGKYYDAKVVSIENPSGGIYQVSFAGYEKSSIQTTRAADMREKSKKPGNYDRARAEAPGRPSAGVKGGKVAKKRHGGRDEAAAQVASSQQAWLKFAKGGKRLKAKAINDQSIFKSPDTVSGKVGVTNSGKGMAKNLPKTKF